MGVRSEEGRGPDVPVAPEGALNSPDPHCEGAVPPRQQMRQERREIS
jgi:hypothetical protein